jgi:hypothetical protein
MEAVITVQSGLLIHALKILQRRGIITHRGGGHNEVLKEESRTPPSDVFSILHAHHIQDHT